MKLSIGSLAALAVLASGSALAAGSATVQLDGGAFIQSGSVTNTSAAGTDLVKLVYSLGAPADGIAIWEINSSSGTHSDFLAANWYSTETWSALAVPSGGSFSFGGLDIDYIITVSPVNVTGGFIDNTGTSLAHASVTAYFSDGSFGSAALNQTGWTVDQNLRIVGAVPEPQTYALMGIGLAFAGFVARRRRPA